MAQQMYIGNGEIEAEPDGDSDDVDVVSGNYQANRPGNLAIAMDAPIGDEISQYGVQTIAQDIKQNLQAGYGGGVPVTATYATTQSGDLDLVARDATGAMVNEVFLNTSGSTVDVYYGSTRNGSFLNGGFWATTVADASSVGSPSIETAEFDARNIMTGDDFINPEGTSDSVQWATNADGSQTFLSNAALTRTGSTVTPGSGGTAEAATLLDQISSDATDYSRDMLLDYVKEEATSATVRNSAAVLSAGIAAYDAGQLALELGGLSTDLVHEYNAGQDMSKTATELSSKVAVFAMKVIAAEVSVANPQAGAALGSFADSIVKAAVDVGNQTVGALIDSYFEWQETHSASAVGAVTAHAPMPLAFPDTPALPSGMAAIAGPSSVAQSVLYRWSGLDTAGFIGSQFPGVGVQDTTGGFTEVVAAGYNGATPTYSDASNHNLIVTLSDAGMTSSTGSGSDSFVIAAPNQVVNGGAGSNTVRFSGNLADYRISSGSGMTVVIDTNAARDGYNTLTNIQTLRFADQSVAASSAAATSITATNTVGVYRFFDTTFGTHFFTSDPNEVATVKATRSDLSYEGPSFQSQSPSNHDPSDAPVYRFFDSVFGTHFYTASSTERDSVQSSRPDLKYEGIGFYEHAIAQPGDEAVYRFFDSIHGTHFYTDSASERSGILGDRPDLKDEGVGFYAPRYAFG